VTSPEIPLGKYMVARLVESKSKTAVYDIISVHHGTKLGQIRWYGPWRQYVSEPEPRTIWNEGCHEAMRDFLRKLMDAKKPILKYRREAES
jgi:hypothetical protein